MVDLDGLAREVRSLEAEIKAVERITMSFAPIEIDAAHKIAFVKIAGPGHLDSHYCDTLEQCTDLLWKFLMRRRSSGVRSG